MYRTLKRGLAALSITCALILGTTAITILTSGVGAGTAFAHGHVKDISYQDDLVGYCTRNRRHSRCGPTFSIRTNFNNCIDNPFGTGFSLGDRIRYGSRGCVGTFTPQQLIVAKTRYCTDNQSNDNCIRDVLARPNAAQWFKRHGPWLPHVMDTTRGSHFLRGYASGLNATNTDSSLGRVVQNHTALNFKTARYNGATLGGNATDGLAFFRVVHPTLLNGYDYAGILNGTNLGAPVTNRTGTARWAGQVSVLAGNNDGVLEQDFVLGVNFANRTITSFESHFGSRFVWYRYTLHVEGSYDTNGVMVGTTKLARFTNNDPLRPRAEQGGSYTGILRGLIGEKGAIGAWVRKPGSDSHLFTGGFVARPAEDVEGASLSIQNSCSTNPSSHGACSVSDRRTATIVANCQRNPFSTTGDQYGRGGCAKTLGADGLRVAKMQRIASCNIEGSENDNRCTSTEVVAAICDYDLFGVGCLSHTNDHLTYNSVRLERARVCATNLRDPRCTGARYGTGERYVSLDNICSRVPFMAACADDQYKSNRYSQAKACASDPLTAPGCGYYHRVVIAKICKHVPFTAYCSRVNYKSDRLTQAKICAGDRDALGCDNSYKVTDEKICNLVPFGSSCTNGAYENYRVRQITTCAANLNASGCGSTYYLPNSTTCNRVPFGAACRSSYYNTKRIEQVTTCAANLSASGCGDSYYLPERKTCNLVPFGVACASDTYQSDRVTKAKTCAGNPNASGCDGTYYVDTSKICDLVPFIGTCLNNGDYKDNRISRADYCTTNMSDLVCNGVVSPANICSQLPFHSTCTGNDRDRLVRARLCAADDGKNTLCNEDYVSPADICSQLPFGSDCTGNDLKRFERAERCVRTPEHFLCDTNDVTPADICNQLPFRSGCTDNAGAKLARANRCLLTPEDSRCHNDYVSTDDICSQRPFNAICDEGLDDLRLDRAELCVAKDNDDGTDPNPNLNPLCNKQYVNTAQICSQLPYHSTCSDTRYEPDRERRITFCNEEVNKGNERCTPTEVVDALCSINLFGTGCVNHSDPDGVHGDKRRDLIANCNEAGNVGVAECRPADVVAAICAVNLFARGCVNGADPDGSYERERTGRIKLCNIEGNAANPLCTPADVVDAVCDNNLFGWGCLNSYDSDGSYASKRTTQINFCSANPGKSGCTGTQQDDICSYAPFSSFCSNHDASEGKRTESEYSACRKPGTNNLACHGIEPISSEKAGAALWADSLITLANPKGISSITSVDLSDPQYRKNQFLSGLRVASDVDHLPTRRKTPFTVLTLADNFVDSTKALEGYSLNGVAFFGPKVGVGVFPFYAGILSKTSLGRPITGVAGEKAIWVGVFQAIGGKKYAVKRNFDLTVDFTDGATGTIDAFVQAKGDERYHLTGTFNDIGIITGTVDYGSFTGGNSDEPTGDRLPGKLTGLIGEQGAVGAFIADMDGRKGFYSGGFVANPGDVRYSDWVETTTPDTARSTPPINQFLTGSDGTVASGTPVTITFANASFRGVSFVNGDGDDGVQLFADSTNGIVTNVHAGILETTYLGRPLTATTAAGHWEGRLVSLVAGGATPTYEEGDFYLDVSFNSRTISGVADALTQSGNHASTYYFTDTTFDADGVFDTTMHRVDGRLSNSRLTGLIGQGGAVGAFISNANAPVSYGGGFVARPRP